MLLFVMLCFSLFPSAGAASMWTRTYGGSGNDCPYSLVATADGGYALAGSTEFLGAGGEDFWLIKTDSLGNMQWNRRYGGIGNDVAHSLIATSDGGYVLSGSTESFGAGGNDFWLVKIDALGNMQWNKTYGGASADIAYSLVATYDGGYAVAGVTSSFGAGSGDFWLIKTDALGNMQWNKTYGEASDDGACSLVATSEGGYTLVGHTFSFGAGGSDIWLVKTDALGNTQWSRTYGGLWDDYASSLVATSDGGCTLVGLIYSQYAEGTPPDICLIKSDMWGNMLWNKTCGLGINDEDAYALAATVDGGYVIACAISSKFLNTGLLKTDALGNMQWNKNYWGGSMVLAHTVVLGSDGGYALAGNTDPSSDGDEDFWIIKVSESGSRQWSQEYGETGNECAYSIVATSDGGYALVGSTGSFGAGGTDVWLVKIDAFGNLEWNKTFGGALSDEAYSLVATPDGGYAIAGYTNSFGAGRNDVWLIKTDAHGNAQWNRTFGGANDDLGRSLIVTSDGGFAVAGCTSSFGGGVYDFWLVKTDALGNLQWGKTYGGVWGDYAYSLVEGRDGGYAMLGLTWSRWAEVIDLTPPEVWLVKTDVSGNIRWNQTYGWGMYDLGGCYLVATSDRGYALVDAFSFIKTDSLGNAQWNITSEEMEWGVFRSLAATSDGGYAIAGETNFIEGASSDFWLVKIDAAGHIEWNQTYGGAAYDGAFSVVEALDGGYALCGSTMSFGAGARDFWLVKTNEFGVVPEPFSLVAISLLLVAVTPILVHKKRLLRRCF
jgi:predicted secreted protein